VVRPEEEHGLLKLNKTIDEASRPREQRKVSVGFNEQKTRSTANRLSINQQEASGSRNTCLNSGTERGFLTVPDGHHVFNHMFTVLPHGFEVLFDVRSNHVCIAFAAR
jgi:hypothetical protein